MNFHHSSAELFVPDSLGESEALSRVTHLGIGAYVDQFITSFRVEVLAKLRFRLGNR